jgi:transposase-like protein
MASKDLYQKTFLKPQPSIVIEETRMSETQVQKKKRKKQQLTMVEQVQEETTVQNAVEVTKALEELKAQGIRFDIQVCPKCKSPKVRRANSQGGDMWGNLGMVQPSYECTDCGWQERLVLKATNKPLSVREVELIREAMEIEDET